MAISNKEISENVVIKSCKDEDDLEDLLNKKKTKKIDRPLISIDGEIDIETHIAKCCQPLPGDSIIGFITRGYGIAIHRRSCKMILKTDQHQRLTPASWINKRQNAYSLILF